MGIGTPPPTTGALDIGNVRSLVRTTYADALLTAKLKGIKGKVGYDLAVKATARIVSRQTGRPISIEEVLAMVNEDR